MTNEERLKLVQEVKDKLFPVVDSIRFGNSYSHSKSLGTIKEIMGMLDILSNDCLYDIEDSFKIIVTEDVVIENEEKVLVPTNVSGKKFDDEIEIIFNGFIPSSGYLTLSNENSDGLQIYVKNEVPKEIFEYYDLAGYHYCNPMTTEYFGPGIYKIDKGTVIGIGFKQKNIKNRNRERVR